MNTTTRLPSLAPMQAVIDKLDAILPEGTISTVSIDGAHAFRVWDFEGTSYIVHVSIDFETFKVRTQGTVLNSNDWADIDVETFNPCPEHSFLKL